VIVVTLRAPLCPLVLGCLLAAAAPRALAQSSDDLRAERTMGSPNAPVTMYIMSDFECPFCGDFARKTFPLIERDYVTTGKMKVVFVNMPLSAIHPNAEAAAEAAMCAARQHKFWQMHDLLFRYQSRWVDLNPPRPFFLALADSVGANRQAFATCVESGETRALVKADYEGSLRSGANATPSFYIEGGLMSGDRPMDQFRPILDSIYRARTSTAKGR
jgi:protein-disulfide isomerase